MICARSTLEMGGKARSASDEATSPVHNPIWLINKCRCNIFVCLSSLVMHQYQKSCSNEISFRVQSSDGSRATRQRKSRLEDNDRRGWETHFVWHWLKLIMKRCNRSENESTRSCWPLRIHVSNRDEKLRPHYASASQIKHARVSQVSHSQEINHKIWNVSGEVKNGGRGEAFTFRSAPEEKFLLTYVPAREISSCIDMFLMHELGRRMCIE